jgi:hypothetical protein
MRKEKVNPKFRRLGARAEMWGEKRTVGLGYLQKA